MRHISSAISLVLILLLLLNLTAVLGVFGKLQCAYSDLGERYITCLIDGKATTFQKSFNEKNK